MTPKLIRSLTIISDNISVSRNEKSIYFNIGRIIVRVSDHFSTSSEHDLAVFINPRGYTVIPVLGNNREVQYFYNINDVINFINNFEKCVRILYGERPKISNYEPLYDIVTPEIWNCLNTWGIVTKYNSLLFKLYNDSKKSKHPEITNELKKINGRKSEDRVYYLNELIKKYCPTA